MADKIVHFEIMGPDGTGLTAFYQDVFGWQGEGVPGFDQYNMVGADQIGIPGAIGKGGDEIPNYVAMYIEVDDIDAYLEKINAAGGGTIMPRTVIPDTVTFALFTDPAGNMMGVVEADS